MDLVEYLSMSWSLDNGPARRVLKYELFSMVMDMVERSSTSWSP